MRLRRLGGLVAAVGFSVFLAQARADEPVLLQYKFAKGDQLIYKSVQESKQTQTILSNKIETATLHQSIMLRRVDEVDPQGTATLKTKAERRKVKIGNDFAFDSKSTERDTTSEIGAAATPLLERLTGSEYDVIVNTRGAVVDIKGYVELVGDLVKDNPVAQQIIGGGGGKAGAQIAEQHDFVVLSEKPVSPGDQWEVPFDVDLPSIGKVKGKVVYVYEGDDKVGDRKTVRIGVTTEFSIDLKIEAGGAKVSGTLSTSSATGTVQFDPQAGRVLTSKRSTSISGQIMVEAGGMTFPVESQSDESQSIELLEKVPE
ncbi:MAG TPA: hypothetical protein VGM05_24535 [Planctomycetaceae bacterium]|jgi:hypothetical protein